PGTRNGPARVRTHEAGTELGSDRGEVRIRARPGVVDEIGTGLTGGASNLVAPGVHTDNQLRVPLADAGDERDNTVDLRAYIHGFSRAGLDPADIDHIGAVGHRAVHRIVRVGVREGRALVVERVRCPVDNRHH